MKRKREMKVREIMSRPIITEDEETLVTKIVKEMADLGIGSVVITSEGKPAGIITERDIALKVLLKDKRASEIKAKEIMSSPLISIEPETSIDEACELAAKKRIKRLPVVENGVPIGIVSVRNILTLKPEYVRRFYPWVRILASGWTLERLERCFSECEIFLSKRDVKRYKGRLKEVYDELSELVSYYVDDKELKDVFERIGQLYHEVEGEGERGISILEQRERLEDILRKFRHTTYWRKRQSMTSFGSGIFFFRDFRYGTGKELRLPFKRTRPL
ncbi:MAG: CBS domain-containing protein [Candidatus Methanospirareceae archaeon]